MHLKCFVVNGLAELAERPFNWIIQTKEWDVYVHHIQQWAFTSHVQTQFEPQWELLCTQNKGISLCVMVHAKLVNKDGLGSKISHFFKHFELR